MGWLAPIFKCWREIGTEQHRPVCKKIANIEISRTELGFRVLDVQDGRSGDKNRPDLSLSSSRVISPLNFTRVILVRLFDCSPSARTGRSRGKSLKRKKASDPQSRGSREIFFFQIGPSWQEATLEVRCVPAMPQNSSNCHWVLRTALADFNLESLKCGPIQRRISA